MDIDQTAFAYVPTTGVRRVFETRVVTASNESLKGLGCLVDEPKTFPIEITRWPAEGWRPVDRNSGDQGGVTEGLFEFWWKGETLYARNNAVGDSYLSEQLAGRCCKQRSRPIARARVDLACQLSPGWRSTFLSLARPELCRAARSAGR